MAISVAAHAAVAIGVILAPSPLPHAGPARANIELTLEIHAAMDEIVAVEPPPPEPRVPESVRGARVPERAAARALVREPSNASAPAAITVETPTIEPEATALPRETEEQRRERLRLMLDPTAVARGVFVVDATMPTRGARRHAVRPSAEELGAELSASLRRSAMSKAYGGRPPPQLRARPDGTLVYAGHAFSATILADGSVRFDDRPNAQVEGVSLSGTFDVTDAIMRANGADPYRAERAWFMRHTEAVREQLEDAYRAQSQQIGMRRLRGRLARLWQDDTLSPEQKRRAIFEEWAEVEAGSADDGARALVEQFVRDNLPAGGVDAYSNEELRRLNGRPGGHAPFAPYR